MMPPSHAATSSPPKRGLTATTRPAAISTMPTMCMASAALPGMMSLNAGARYRVQSSVRTPANLSMPNRIGATVNAIRSSMNACATGSLRRASEAGIGVGRRAAATLMAGLLPRGSRVTPLAIAGGQNLRQPLEAYEVPQALVVLAACGASLEMLVEPGQAPIGVLAGEL